MFFFQFSTSVLQRLLGIKRGTETAELVGRHPPPGWKHGLYILTICKIFEDINWYLNISVDLFLILFIKVFMERLKRVLNNLFNFTINGWRRSNKQFQRIVSSSSTSSKAGSLSASSWKCQFRQTHFHMRMKPKSSVTCSGRWSWLASLLSGFCRLWLLPLWDLHFVILFLATCQSRRE